MTGLLEHPSTEWIVYALIFCAGFMLLQALSGAGKYANRMIREANHRLRALAKDETPTSLLAELRKSRGLDRFGQIARFHRGIGEMVVQSGLRFGAIWIYVAMFWSAMIMAGLFIWKMGALWAALPGLAIGASLPLLVLKFLVGRRRKKAVSQLPEAIDVVVRSLGAGHPVPVAMALVGREMPDPIGTEFGMASDEISFGSATGAAVQRMAERVGHEDFELFAAMVRLQERTGGNLAELLRANASTIRARQKMRLKIKAASAEGRMSAMILNAAPLLLFLAIQTLSPEFYGEVWGNPLVMPVLIGVVIWMGIGNLVMRKMINFKI
jgi:tight adherence protein B